MKAPGLVFLLLVVVGCKQDDNKIIADEASVAYINEVLDLMQQWSINRKTIDWPSFREEVVSKVIVPSDIDDAIETALAMLNDHHSFAYRNGRYIANPSGTQCSTPTSFYTPVDHIGYLKIATSTASDNSSSIAYQNEISRQDNETVDITGWIVDLRGNLGGNMWPMLAGVGPILGENIAGYFIDPDDNKYNWEYKDGKSMYQGNTVVEVPEPYSLKIENPKVAVLIDEGTASSGEAIAVAFKGRASTKFFGKPTCGLSTANGTFTLSDGGMLYLTTSVMADRNQNKFGGPIPPDVAIDGNQAQIDAAVDWLNEQ